MKEKAEGISIPIVTDYVDHPYVYYGEDLTAIYFQTEDEKHGRITFENLDSLKICRGENIPYSFSWNQEKYHPWVFKIANSKWQEERYEYEKLNYGTSYEFGGNVDEMLTDFSHYLFKFHDQFVEVISRGFWFEKDEISLVNRKLQEGHPFLNLKKENVEKFAANSLTYQVRKNLKTNEDLIADAKFCSQKLMEFALELDGEAKVDMTLILSYRKGKLTSSLRDYFWKQIAVYEGVVQQSEIMPYIENYMKNVSIRRKEMGK